MWGAKCFNIVEPTNDAQLCMLKRLATAQESQGFLFDSTQLFVAY